MMLNIQDVATIQECRECFGINYLQKKKKKLNRFSYKSTEIYKPEKMRHALLFIPTCADQGPGSGKPDSAQRL